jgi:hypothetical protein
MVGRDALEDAVQSASPYWIVIWDNLVVLSHLLGRYTNMRPLLPCDVITKYSQR